MFVASVGMVSPIGLDAPATCAALRAGIAGFEELPYHDQRGEPIVGAFVPDLSTEFFRPERVLEMAAHALSECVENSLVTTPGPLPLLLCLADDGQPGGAASLAADAVPALEKRTGLTFDRNLSRVGPSGRPGGFSALSAARRYLADGRAPAVLICGTDSFVNARSLAWLDAHDRLKTETNSDGVIPGEAAAAVLLVHEPVPGPLPQTRIVGLGFGEEPSTILDEEPLLATGLADALRKALAEAGIGMETVPVRISDVTGEEYGFREHALAMGRVMRVVRKEPMDLWHPAEAMGDTGAAAGLAQLVLARHAILKNYGGDRFVCFLSGSDRRRAVAVVRKEVSDGR